MHNNPLGQWVIQLTKLARAACIKRVQDTLTDSLELKLKLKLKTNLYSTIKSEDSELLYQCQGCHNKERVKTNLLHRFSFSTQLTISVSRNTVRHSSRNLVAHWQMQYGTEFIILLIISDVMMLCTDEIHN